MKELSAFALHTVAEVAPRFLRSPGFDTFFIESPQVGGPRSVLLEHNLQCSAYDPGLNIGEFQEGYFTNHQCFTSDLHIQDDARSVALSVTSGKEACSSELTRPQMTHSHKRSHW